MGCSTITSHFHVLVFSLFFHVHPHLGPCCSSLKATFLFPISPDRLNQLSLFPTNDYKIVLYIQGKKYKGGHKKGWEDWTFVLKNCLLIARD